MSLTIMKAINILNDEVKNCTLLESANMLRQTFESE